MAQTSLVHNPFMLMLDPEVVLSAVQRSETLEQLARRVCHPLDRQTTPKQADVDSRDRQGSGPLDDE